MIKEKYILDNKCYIIFRNGNYEIGKINLNIFDKNKIYGELIVKFQNINSFRDELQKDKEFIKYSKNNKSYDEKLALDYVFLSVYVDDIDKKRWEEILNDNSKWE